jgi:hypothetical protein
VPQGPPSLDRSSAATYMLAWSRHSGFQRTAGALSCLQLRVLVGRLAGTRLGVVCDGGCNWLPLTEGSVVVTGATDASAGLSRSLGVQLALQGSAAKLSVWGEAYLSEALWDRGHTTCIAETVVNFRDGFLVRSVAVNTD